MSRSIVFPVFAFCLLLLAAPALGPFQARAATFDWQKATASIGAERDRAEACSKDVKSYGDDATVQAAKSLYDQARGDLDLVRQGLIATLSDAATPPRFDDLEAALKRSVAAREELCNLAWRVKPGDQKGERAATVDLGSDFMGVLLDATAAIFGNGKDQENLTRRTIRTSLEGTSLRSFDAVTTGIGRVADAPPAAAEPPAAFTRMEVYFGTDRADEGTAAAPRFTAGRAHRLQLGKVQVTVPKSHRFANIERRGIQWVVFSEREDAARHFTVQQILLQDEAPFAAELQALTKDATRFANQAFVFVHGFNVSFDEAAFRTAQFTYDLRFDGAPIFYSWPSRGAVKDYTYDQQSVRQARGQLQAFLELVRARSGATTVHLIAHSMGNDPLMEVLKDMQRTSADPTRPLFNQIVLAAPDIDRDLFIELAKQVNGVAAGVTLYASANDRALKAAKIVAGGVPRAGDVPDDGPIVLDTIDTIDATTLGTDVFGLNHSDYADSPVLLTDIGSLLMSQVRPPDKRLVALRPIEVTGGRYWAYPHF